uniref:hypothetical protein n=1 Tax=Methylotuvimicrobium sp. KM2 TaxID=3133976 RepID=UPI004047DB1C
MPYADQWAFLSTLKRLTLFELRQLVEQSESQDGLLDVRMPIEEEDVNPDGYLHLVKTINLLTLVSYRQPFNWCRPTNCISKKPTYRHLYKTKSSAWRHSKTRSFIKRKR